MYFKNRAEAGKKLAASLEKYKTQNIVVVALDTGSAIVAAQVAIHLHSNLLLYMVKNIYLPGDIELIAGVGSEDTFTYNKAFSAGEVDEYQMEYHQYIEQKRIEKNHELHALVGKDGEINRDMLRHRTIILVSDGLEDGFQLGVVAEYLKTVAIKSLVIATPVASVPAVDQMHLIGDDLACLGVVGNYMGTDHYYDENVVPDVEGVVKIMHNITFSWEHAQN